MATTADGARCSPYDGEKHAEHDRGHMELGTVKGTSASATVPGAGLRALGTGTDAAQTQRLGDEERHDSVREQHAEDVQAAEERHPRTCSGQAANGASFRADLDAVLHADAIVGCFLSRCDASGLADGGVDSGRHGGGDRTPPGLPCGLPEDPEFTAIW